MSFKVYNVTIWRVLNILTIIQDKFIVAQLLYLQLLQKLVRLVNRSLHSLLIPLNNEVFFRILYTC